MLIHPWDAAVDEVEWREWAANGHDFGELVVNGDTGHPPAVVPTHFVLEGSTLLVHLARPNPVWRDIERDPNVVFSVVDDYAYVPSVWRAAPGVRDEDGVPTSYYSAVQFICRAEIIDEPDAKAELLRRQLAHFQPRGDHGDVAVGAAPYGRMLSGIRGLHLHVTAVIAKFKYDDQKPVDHRVRVAEHLTTRADRRDLGAAEQQRRRTDRIGTWQPPTSITKGG